MRILHVAERLSARGGADWHLLGVLDALSADHEVHLVVGAVDGTAAAPCTVSVKPGVDARKPTAVDLDADLQRIRPDVIHLHNIVNPTLLEWATRHDALITVQDHRFFCPGRGMWTATGVRCSSPMSRANCAHCFSDASYFEQIYRLTAQRLAPLMRLRVTVLSSYMKRELVAVGVPAPHIEVIPPFVHGLSTATTSDGPPCVLFAGRLARAKGTDEAIETWRRSGVTLPLVFAGTGPERNTLERRGFDVLGWVPHHHLASVYRRARVVLMPSRWQEPFGIVGLEALTLGIPVAAWDSGGVSEWHRGAGLVPWGDIDGLASALCTLIGTQVPSPTGFDRISLMQKLIDLYDRSRR